MSLKDLIAHPELLNKFNLGEKPIEDSDFNPADEKWDDYYARLGECQIGHPHVYRG